MEDDKKRYWLRGGIIATILFVLFHFYPIAIYTRSFFDLFAGDTFILIYSLLAIPVYLIALLMQIPLFEDIFLAPVPSYAGIIIGLICWFIIGSLIGEIYNKIKIWNKNLIKY